MRKILLSSMLLLSCLASAQRPMDEQNFVLEIEDPSMPVWYAKGLTDDLESAVAVGVMAMYGCTSVLSEGVKVDPDVYTKRALYFEKFADQKSPLITSLKTTYEPKKFGKLVSYEDRDYKAFVDYNDDRALVYIVVQYEKTGNAFLGRCVFSKE